MIRRRRDRRAALQVSEAELAAMTADMEDAHHETLPRLHAAVSEWTEQIAKQPKGMPTRRGFLVGMGAAAAGGIALAACGSSSSKTGSSIGATSSTTAASPGLEGDLAVAGLAASLENLAVGTYQAALDAAAAGKLGAVPPAVATFAKTAQQQHKDHAAAWNAVLTGAGKRAVSGVDMTVKSQVVDPGFAKVTNVPQLAALALTLEDGAAATYLNGIRNALTMPASIKVAATIQPVEMQHAAILHFLLGDYPVPNAFASTDGARPLSDQIG